MQKQTLASHCPDLTSAPLQRVGLDAYDELSLVTIPAALRPKDDAVLLDATTDIYREGARGPALRRLLAREISLGRAQLRFRESLSNFELERLAQGKGNLRRVEILERLVAGQHHRLMSTIDKLARLSSSASTPLRVTAHYAQVNVEKRP